MILIKNRVVWTSSKRTSMTIHKGIKDSVFYDEKENIHYVITSDFIKPDSIFITEYKKYEVIEIDRNGIGENIIRLVDDTGRTLILYKTNDQFQEMFLNKSAVRNLKLESIL